MRSRSGISVMFMTFIAVCILSMIFLTYYLYLTQQSLLASEAQRIYAEAAQENIDAFYYPPGSEASSQGVSQRLVIHNRGIGTVIKYIFVRHGQGLEGPINRGDIVLRSGESYNEPITDRLIPDGAELLIVTERGSVFTAREGYFGISLNPASLRLLLPEERKGDTTLIITSSNYEGKLKVVVGEECVVRGGAEFNLTRGGIYAVPIECAPSPIPGSYTYLIKVEDEGTRYGKTATLKVEVREIEAIAVPFSYVLIEDVSPREVSGKPKDRIYLTFRIRGYNDYHGRVSFELYSSVDVIVPGSIRFDPPSPYLKPEDPEKTITLGFNIRSPAPSGQHRVWIKVMEGSTTLDTDYFILQVEPG